MSIEKMKANPHLVTVYKEYMQARQMRRDGLICNISSQRESLRRVYRLIAGKSK